MYYFIKLYIKQFLILIILSWFINYWFLNIGFVQ